MITESPSPPLRIWTLLGARAGDNDQVIALAEALGLPFEVKELQYGPLHLLGPRLLRRSLLSLTKRSREAILGEPPPDLTISTGHRSVAVVQALRRRSGGRMRSIHVGFPRISPANFDLVIATPQYPIADESNLLRVPYALTRAATDVAHSDKPILAEMSRPRRLLILGGPTLFWRVDEAALLGALGQMLNEAGADGGSVLVTTSPRTPRTLVEIVADKLHGSAVPSLLVAPGQEPSYAALLGAADSIRVTADSVSMASDAIWTGKPVAIVPITKSAVGRVVIAMNDAVRPGRRLYPQDLRYFWAALAEIGVGERPSLPRTSVDEEMRKVLHRVEPIIAAIRESNN